MDSVLPILKSEEKAVFALRTLYSGYGYQPFKMSKFEPYDLYVKNKDFLVSDTVITFNDTNGALLALKPDVTLSLVKRAQDEKGVKQKFFYNENVYRVSGSTHTFKEIMQTGLECIGDIDLYDVTEAVFLAAESLSVISDDFVLDISHMGVVSAVLNVIGAPEDFQIESARLIGEKNRHELLRLCAEYDVDKEKTELLTLLVSLYGKPGKVLEKLKAANEQIASCRAVKELEQVCALLCETRHADKINIDFSVVNDMRYYNSIVFKGFISGVPDGVLSGGRYDRLMKKMGKKSGAVGFAVYLDELQQLRKDEREFDVDVLVLYGENTSAKKVFETVNELIKEGKSVSAQKAVPKKLRYAQLIDII